MHELDAREARFLPRSAANELGRATSRLIDGDYSGAITSACGAVDLATQAIYANHGLGNPGTASFQTKVNTALKRLDVFEEMTTEFVNVGMDSEDASAVVDHLKKASNHAAHALQVLRHAMGDTHGSKPALRQTAYDAVKWSSAICGLLNAMSKAGIRFKAARLPQFKSRLRRGRFARQAGQPVPPNLNFGTSIPHRTRMQSNRNSPYIGLDISFYFTLPMTLRPPTHPVNQPQRGIDQCKERFFKSVYTESSVDVLHLRATLPPHLPTAYTSACQLTLRRCRRATASTPRTSRR